jgi:crotonobetainyl-CoA:carnitine CoA-transferase CaiB-like acyl-CoA transferase
MHNITPRLSETPGTFRLPAPSVGQHNAEIYGAIGYSPEQIERLKSDGII